jgi:hypothetical protein
MNEWMRGISGIKRKAKVTGKEEINGVVWKWFTNTRSENIYISGQMV